MEKTTLIMNGLTLDKAVFNDILKKIANDMHIKYARDKIEKHYTKKKIMKIVKKSMNTCDYFSMVPGINILSSLVTVPMNKIINEIDKNIPLHADKMRTKDKNNFDYWNLFLSNISGTQPLISSTIHNKNTKQLFSGRPYYENKYIDSIVVEIKLNSKINKKQIKYLIDKYIESVFYAEYICDDIDHIVSEPLIKKHIIATLSERSLFGIYFLSGLLKELYGNNEVNFEFSNNLINDNNGLNEDGAYIRELVLLAGNPGKINFYNQNKGNGNNIIRLLRLDSETSQNKSNKSYGKLFYGIKTDDGFLKLLIPIKRVISLPYSFKEQIENFGKIPSTFEESIYPLPDCFNNLNLRIFSLGGGEHNLPLVHLINIIRHKDKDKRRFGFLENVFDRDLRGISQDTNPEFLICLEKFVSGVNSLPRSRKNVASPPSSMLVEAQSNEAEILKIDFNDKIEGYAVYGFSAPMTRYAFLALLYALDEKNEKLFLDSINNKSNKYSRDKYIDFDVKKSAVYYLGEDEENYIILRNKFDKMDVLNNSDDEPVKKVIIENMFLRSLN